MTNRLDLTGQTFGRLKPIKVDHIKNNRTYWLCKCDCGNEVVIVIQNLRNGHTKSCGCIRMEKSSERMIRHGIYRTRFYNIWKGMKQRCNNKNSPHYVWYGGRGITVCDRWYKFENFKEDMYQSYLAHVEGFGEKNTTIERIDVNGNYEPNNCKWATIEEQANNTKSNHFIGVNGEQLTMKEAAKKYNIRYQTVYERLHSGKDIFGNVVV